MTFDKYMAQKEFPKPREDFAGFMCFIAITFACWPLWTSIGLYRLAWIARYGVVAAREKMEEEDAESKRYDRAHPGRGRGVARRLRGRLR